MKKLYTTPAYKVWHKRKLEKSQKSTRISKSHKRKETDTNQDNQQSQARRPTKLIIPPSDFRVIENSEECLLFFRRIQNEENITYSNNHRFVKISLENVEEIDSGTISILTAIKDDLKSKGINLNGNFPKSPKCRKFIVESGFLNDMVDENNRRFPKTDKSDMLIFEKGSGVLTAEDNKRVGESVKRVVKHLTGESKHFNPVKTVLLEICGNSIEHAYTQNKQWLLVINYEKDKVVFTVTDVGRGILGTLYKKPQLIATDFLTGKTSIEILKGAFRQKYGSSTQEENRNKGLPAIKYNYDQGNIRKLKVLTNDVILHFDNDSLSKTFKKGSPKFRGTYYQWEMTKECIYGTATNSNENN